MFWRYWLPSESGGGERLHLRAGKWWGQLHRAAKVRADRATGHKGWIAALAWEKQKRGLAHVHGVLSAGSPIELRWAKAYVEALCVLAQPKGFGFVDGWHKVGRKLWPGEQAGAYLSSYFVRGRGGKAPITENVLAGDLPKLVVFVSRHLTAITGCTMRNLRLVRRVWAWQAGRTERPNVREWDLLVATCLIARIAIPPPRESELSIPPCESDGARVKHGGWSGQS